MRLTIRGAVAIGLPLLVILSACTVTAPRPTHSLRATIEVLAGLSIDQARKHFHGDPQIEYDLSAPILNTPASGSLATESDWTVVAGCPATKTAEGSALGVIKSGAVTPAILQSARKGAFQHLLVECR